MKRVLWVIAAAAALLVIGVLLAGCAGGKAADTANPTVEATPPTATPAAAEAGTVYTCPMHPEVVSDKPGKCPTCGMNLEPKAK